MAIEESKAMTEIREIRKKLSEQMKNMTDEEIVEFIKRKSAKVEEKFGLNLPRREKTVR